MARGALENSRAGEILFMVPDEATAYALFGDEWRDHAKTEGPVEIEPIISNGPPTRNASRGQNFFVDD